MVYYNADVTSLRLIVVACLVEVVRYIFPYNVRHANAVVLQGEVIARLVVHATMGSEAPVVLTAADVLNSMSREDAIAALQRIANGLPPM